jgi:hypothetical protein
MYKLVICFIALLSVSGFTFEADNYRDKHSASNLLKKIEEGRDRLKKESVEMIMGTVGTRRVKVGRRSYKEVPITGIVGRQMALAILDPDGSIRVARAIKRDPGFEVISSGFTLTMRRENGINSDIACVHPPGGKVVAVKYPVSNEGNRFGSGDPVIEAIYTPFSAEIGTDEVVNKGIDVQNSFIEKAYSRLRERGVLSRAFPGRRIVDVIPKNVLRVLLLNEHIDPGEFKSVGATKALCERVLTIIGTNHDKAYAYSISPAGARGLVQMMPSTYLLLLNKYTSAGLKSNFASAVGDPINAVMAQVLLCDSDWEAIRTKTDIPADRVGPYLAAAYNGGVGRVLNVLSHDEMDWMEDPDQSRKPTMTVSKKVPVKVRTRKGKTAKRYVVKHYSQPIFKNETSKYISQYHWINDYLAQRAKSSDRPPRAEVK